MSQYYDYYNNNNNNNNDYHRRHYGGQDTESSSNEYLDRVARQQRMPNIAADIPTGVLYPHGTHNDPHKKFNYHNNNRAPQTHKKVHIVETEKVMEIGRDGMREVYEEDRTIDVEAHDFIEQKHKKFEMSKWDTMRPY